jgi:hypothetical protein
LILNKKQNAEIKIMTDFTVPQPQPDPSHVEKPIVVNSYTSKGQALRYAKHILGIDLFSPLASAILGYDSQNSNTIAAIGMQIDYQGENSAPTVAGTKIGVAEITLAYLNGASPAEIAQNYDITLFQAFEALAMGFLMRSKNLFHSSN